MLDDIPENEALGLLVNCYASINNFSRCLDGEFPQYKPSNESEVNSTKESIERSRGYISAFLRRFQGTDLGLTAEFRERLLKEKEFLLDVHPEAVYLIGSQKGSPLVYLAHAIERRDEELDGKKHIFLRTRSDEQGCSGISYPAYFQREDYKIYTSDNITWIDYRPRIKHVSQDKIAMLTNEEYMVLQELIQANGFAGKKMLDIVSREKLPLLMQAGMKNYNSLPDFKEIIPRLKPSDN